MSILGTPWVAALAARVMQGRTTVDRRRRPTVFPELPGSTREVTIPTSIAPARAVVYSPSPASQDAHPPVHVNFHGGGFVLRDMRLDDPLCRYLAAHANVVVINVDYVVAPQHRFPAAPRQAFEAVRWVAEHGDEHGWDGSRLTVGGQSAGGAIAAAVARQAFEHGEPRIALQVLHYPPLDLVTRPREKPSSIARPMLRPWMGEVFNGAYLPDRRLRTDRLASPASEADRADLTGIAPALVITAEYDCLRAEAARYAQRLHAAGALVEHLDVPRADHGYDMGDAAMARQTYARIAQCITQATR